MLNLQEFARLEPNTREELIKKFNLVRSGFGSDVRGNEVFMFDGFIQLDLINANETTTNTQQDEGGNSEGITTVTESIPTKRGRKAKVISIPVKK